MQNHKTKIRVKLDWSRLLGFDQAPVSDGANDRTRLRTRLAYLGAKVGGKPGLK